MKFTAAKSTLRQIQVDAVAVFVFSDKKIFAEQTTSLKKTLKQQIERIITLEDFSGKKDSVAFTYTERKLKTPRLILVGLGDSKDVSLETIRRGSAAAAKKAKTLKARHLAFLFPEPPGGFAGSVNDLACAIGEGTMLALYKYDKYFTEKKNEERKVTALTVFSDTETVVKEIKRGLSRANVLCEATYLARDLENAPSNEIYPEALGEAARTSANKYGLRVTIWNKKRIEHEGFGGLLAVNAGSTRPPVFIILEYHGTEPSKTPIVLVGKGITFDTGGISIKPSSGMAEMKMDMSGAAAVIGTMEAATRLKLPVNLVGLVPTTENMPSGSAMKPGDIIKHYGGKTSEVDNTDAEGRLILADALAYAAKYKPFAVIDLATLTGACVVALGSHATGMMGNDSGLMDQLKAAGERTFERVWELPLFEEYEKQIKSDVADVKNVGGRWAGAITAGLFLKKFIGDYKWVHLDIAGTAILEEDFPYAPKGGSGVGVRLLIEFLRNWKK